MNEKDKAKNRCDSILLACFGEEMSKKWWDSPNKAFDGRVPIELWETNNWYEVYNYLLGQLNGDYS